jgi:hypothetical protein
VRNKVLNIGNAAELATVFRLSTVPLATPYTGTSKRSLARQLVVLMVLIGSLLADSGDAEATLCEIETEESQLMSSVADASAIQGKHPYSLALVYDQAPIDACDASSSDDCDINMPGGQPQPPETRTSMRPSAALAQAQGNLASLRPARGLYAELAVPLLPGYYGTLYRPPRS